MSYEPHVNRGWVVELVKCLPSGALSRAWGYFVRRRRPRLMVHVAKRLFVAANGIDLAESVAPLAGYDTLEELFVRRLRAGARPIAPSPAAVVSPVDGAVGACGAVERGTLMQVKGRAYSLARLLDDEEQAARFEGGPYVTVYLAPRDYHRIHAPIAGEIRDATVIPGRLLPVFPESLERIDELFARNERFITYVDSPEAGRVAVVKVGATLVGRISVTYDPSLRTNFGQTRTRRLHYEAAHAIEKGGELGAFELGSTVVLIGEPGRITWDDLGAGAGAGAGAGSGAGSKVRVGMRIGSVTALAVATQCRSGERSVVCSSDRSSARSSERLKEGR